MSPSIREAPPLRLSYELETPNGRFYRWADNEPDPAYVPSGWRHSSTMPGGFETSEATLPRKPSVTYSDLERLSTLRAYGAGGELVNECRLESTPRTSGNEFSVSPAAAGWQTHLEDDPSAQMVYRDVDLSSWTSPSRARQLALYAIYDVLQDFTTEPDLTSALPSLLLTANGRWATGSESEAWYDGGQGKVASVYFDYVARNLSASYIGRLDSFSDDSGSGAIAGTDVVAGASSTGTRTETPTTAQRYAAFLLALVAASATDGDRDFRLRNVAVYGNHGLALRGTEPTAGYYASDIIGHALSAWCPLLNHSTDSITQTAFVIPQAAFLEMTTAGEIVRSVDRYELADWGVWENRTFYYQPRGTNGRNWRARSGPAQLQETGPQVERLWNGIIVRYNDPDGTTRTVGPTGSGADTITDTLLDTDPLNPANELGIRRWDLLDMGIVSTPAAATQIGLRFLAESKLLDSSGQAQLVGTVADDRGIARPVSQVRAGDTICFTDASDTSARRIVRADYDHSSRTCTVDLDAPPEALDALLARLQVVLVRLGLG